jgi:hypothetical protein
VQAQRSTAAATPEALTAGLLLQTQRALERCGIELAALDQDFAKAPSWRRVAGIHWKRSAILRARIISRQREENTVTFCLARVSDAN